VSANNRAVGGVQTRRGTGSPPPHDTRGVRSHYRVTIPRAALGAGGDLLLSITNGTGSWVMWERIRLVEPNFFAWANLGLPGRPPALSGLLLAGSLGGLLLCSAGTGRGGFRPRALLQRGGPTLALIPLAVAY